MKDNYNKLILEFIPNQEKSAELLGRLFEVAQPHAVFSAPVESNGYTVITASELSVGLGFGFGGGGGSGPQPAGEDAPANEGAGVGGGGGGGGTSMARPVAAIIIGPNGVRVEPIVDPTKIAIAFFTAFGAMAMAWRQMSRASRE